MKITPFPTEPRQQIVAGALRDYQLLDESVARWSSSGSGEFTFVTEYRRSPGPLEQDVITLATLNDRELHLGYRARTRTLLSPREYIRYADQEKAILEEGRIEGERSLPRAELLRGVFYWLKLSFELCPYFIRISSQEEKVAVRIKKGLQDLAEKVVQWEEAPWSRSVLSSGSRPRPV